MSSCPVKKDTEKAPITECPVTKQKLDQKLNPLNNMPTLSQEKQAGQSIDLSRDRTLSIIKDKDNKYWEYPSEQQFYNALARKNKQVPAENVQAMVDIHNFLNDGSWQQILDWESKYHCECQDIRLNSFKGRPDDLSPKAWFYTTFMGGEKPFDRHDWYVDRCGKEVRYVIDYYGGSTDTEFHVDVRPAVDTPSAVFDRVRKWAGSLFN